MAGSAIGVPALATKLAPYIPLSVEQRLGDAVDKQIRGAIDTKHLGPAFECGNMPPRNPAAPRSKSSSAGSKPPPTCRFGCMSSAVRRSDLNAFALPGGHIYVYQGLIAKAETPDELAGVIAHEIGHVAHRDGTRAVLQAAGLSFLFGMLLGDFVGGGAVVIAAKTVLQSSYSREVRVGGGCATAST